MSESIDKNVSKPNYFQIILAAVVACVVFGIMQGVHDNYGIMLNPLVAHTGNSYARISFIIGVGAFLYGLLPPFFGMAALRRSNAFVMLCGVVMMAAGLVLTPLCKPFPVLLAVFGVLLPAGTAALGFAIVMGAVTPIMGEKRAAAFSGILQASAGIGDALMSPSLQALIGSRGISFAMSTFSVLILVTFPAVIWLGRKNAAAKNEHAKNVATGRRKIIIDGAHFSDIDGFYDEMERVLTRNLDWRVGRNLNAFNDVLRGGFGVHEYGEPIEIVWRNAEKSKIDLGSDAYQHDGKTFFDTVCEIIRDTADSGYDCTLTFDDASSYDEERSEKKSSIWSIFRDAIREPTYRHILMGFSTCGFNMSIIESHLFSQYVAGGIAPSRSSLIMTVYGVFTMLGAMLAGFLGLKIKQKNVLGSAYALRVFISLAFLLCDAQISLPFALVVTALLGMCGDATVPPTSGIITERFGSEKMPILYGIALFGHQIGAFASASLGGVFVAAGWGYAPLWVVNLLLAAFAATASYTIRNAE